MTNSKQSLGSKIDNKDTDLPTVVSSWSNHFNSWKKMKKNYLLIKYENLLSNTEEEFNKIAKYLNIHLGKNYEMKEVIQAIRNCDFESLKKQENEYGFKESSQDKKGNIKNFFTWAQKIIGKIFWMIKQKKTLKMLLKTR